MRRNLPIGQVLLSNGYITEKQLKRALEVQSKMPDKRLGDILTDLSYVTETQVLECLSQRLNMQFIELKKYNINASAVMSVPMSAAKRFNMIPIDFKNNMLLVATNDPLNFYALDEISAISGHEVSTVLALKEDISYAIDKYYTDSSVETAVKDINREYENFEADDISADSSDIDGTPVVKLVNTIISQAYLKGASDIHIEPFEKSMVVRIRINGDLIYHSTMNIAAHNSVVTRLKILGGMNIAEKRLPQDGRFNFKSGNVNVDIRVSSMPTIKGEKMVLRLLNNTVSSSMFLSINQLGLSEEDLKKLDKMIKTPNGIIFVTGPTGSGKTTTLYAVLNELVKKNINIVTIEDPVEKPIEGVNQVQVNLKAGLNFASALRSILRQDPDVIMIGELRDGETASIGVRAAVTGHLVLATIHTNDASSTAVRLVDMGVEPYLAGASVSGIIAQRLVKVLCPQCKEQYELSESEKLLVEGKADKLYRPVGCGHCNFTGYTGRTAIYEIIEADAGLREIIASGASLGHIREYEKQKGVKFLKDSIIEMALNGQTSIAEMEKIIYSVE